MSAGKRLLSINGLAPWRTAFSTTVLQKGVREHQVISLEDAVYRLTDRIARYFGLIDRGRLVPGYNADLVIFDEASQCRLEEALPVGGTSPDQDPGIAGEPPEAGVLVGRAGVRRME